MPTNRQPCYGSRSMRMEGSDWSDGLAIGPGVRSPESATRHRAIQPSYKVSSMPIGRLTHRLARRRGKLAPMLHYWCMMMRLSMVTAPPRFCSLPTVLLGLATLNWGGCIRRRSNSCCQSLRQRAFHFSTGALQQLCWHARARWCWSALGWRRCY